MNIGQLSPRVLIVIPCLNEVDHIERLLTKFIEMAERIDARIVIADGGSTDGSIEIISRIAARNGNVFVFHNPKRIQSAGVNYAVSEWADNATYLIRIDAHGDYPDDYCDRLLQEADRVGADSVVTSVNTTGFDLLQAANAAAQNSKLGNGGSKHRLHSDGQWVDHGHHALFRISAFRAIGGYDETFKHNEDAELDYRLTAAGYRIWLTDLTQMTYYPRSTIPALFTQYVGYGSGRAQNIMKHGAIPKVRQLLPLLIVPSALLALLAPVHWLALVPLMIWAITCLGYGLMLAFKQRKPGLAIAGISGMVMHFAWSFGFWRQLVSSSFSSKQVV